VFHSRHNALHQSNPFIQFLKQLPLLVFSKSRPKQSKFRYLNFAEIKSSVSPEQRTENELVLLLKEKDKAAFSELYDRYSGALYGVILRILNNDEDAAQDTLQDSFIKIWKSFDSYDRSKGTLFTWILNIGRNTAIDKLRASNRQPIQPLEQGVYIEGAQYHHNVDRIGLKDIVSKLKPEHRTIIDMAYYDGYTQEEISDKLNVPLGTVKTRARTALIELRKIFK
jgi:RNA polymerase sigma-70 factor, ECF subfamily